MSVRTRSRWSFAMPAGIALWALCLLAMGCQKGPLPNGANANVAAAADKESATPETAAEPAPLELPLTEDELREGWISLFDGQSLYGWQAHSTANWQVAEGALRVSEGPPGLLCTTTEFANFVLRLEFRAPEATNSGVFVRTAPQVGPTEVDQECYEVNIAPAENPFPTGSLVKRQKASGGERRPDWQSLEITALDNRITVKLNDREVAAYTDERPLGRGFIGLQKNEGLVEFRKLRLKPLGLASLFNGRDLAGWKEYPHLKSRFTVTPAGELNVKDGRGLLESAPQFADFALRFECQSHGRHLNSGLFFRCIPGEEMNGYECQIQNGYQNGDRTQPLDCGTGGIFRRQNARAVMADDFRWFTTTLVAHGPHLAAWVNGVQVSDWTDERPPHANPRSGQRLAAGTLQIQGHDPTTNLSFRNLHAAELPPRRK